MSRGNHPASSGDRAGQSNQRNLKGPAKWCQTRVRHCLSLWKRLPLQLQGELVILRGSQG
jgi:hypothetical protein